ncbi:hypothetical protein WJX73_001280 [Symbiochloris irregularis]|uniref:Uncharacterized protein n=1 Tax=Symbiochloris irregularis TaxID=706552 RepID=A0AAW1PZ66_9CHLO
MASQGAMGGLQAQLLDLVKQSNSSLEACSTHLGDINAQHDANMSQQALSANALGQIAASKASMPAWAEAVIKWTTDIGTPEGPCPPASAFWRTWDQSSRARYLNLSDYERSGLPDTGLRELWADCHQGIALQKQGRTWSIMQLEHAARFEAQPSEGVAAWRDGRGLLSAPQIAYRKTIYFDLCKRILQQCLAATAHSAPFTPEQALTRAIQGFIAFTGQQDTTKPYSLTQMANGCPRVEKAHPYETYVLRRRVVQAEDKVTLCLYCSWQQRAQTVAAPRAPAKTMNLDEIIADAEDLRSRRKETEDIAAAFGVTTQPVSTLETADAALARLSTPESVTLLNHIKETPRLRCLKCSHGQEPSMLGPLTLPTFQRPTLSLATDPRNYKSIRVEAALKSIFEDCHLGIELTNDTRTYSLMQILKALHFRKGPQHLMQQWRSDKGLFSEKQAYARKVIFFDLCKRIQADCEGAKESDAPFSQDQALRKAISDFVTSMGEQEEGKTWSLSEMAKHSVGLGTPHNYQIETLKWLKKGGGWKQRKSHCKPATE